MNWYLVKIEPHYSKTRFYVAIVALHRPLLAKKVEIEPRKDMIDNLQHQNRTIFSFLTLSHVLQCL
jgi:hypothetical protein